MTSHSDTPPSLVGSRGAGRTGPPPSGQELGSLQPARLGNIGHRTGTIPGAGRHEAFWTVRASEYPDYAFSIRLHYRSLRRAGFDSMHARTIVGTLLRAGASK